MINIPETYKALNQYVRSHPEEVARAIRSALGMRVGVPLAALRWLGKQLEDAGKAENLQIDSVPPGLKISGDFNMMKTPVSAGAVIHIERVVANATELTIAVRLEDVHLNLNGESNTPVAALIKAGALDLKNPGSLLLFMPNRSPIIADAQGNRIVLDLMREPKIANNPLVRNAVALLTAFVTLNGVQTDSGHVDFAFRPLPSGIRGAADAFRKHLVRPSVSRFLPRLS